MKQFLSNSPSGTEPGLPGRALRTTLGLLPVLAVSTGMGLPVIAQEVIELDPLTLQAGKGESASGYKTTNSSSAKRPAAIVDTPKSVTVITQKQIEERGATSLSEILSTTPGITIRAGEGGVQAGDNIYIRGFDASTETMIDGIRNSSRTSYESFNLESVEVTRGSDGAEAGAGAEGGSVNLNTKVPLPGKFDTVGLSYGTGNYKRATLDSNREFGAFGARLNLMYQDADDLGGKKGKTSDRIGIAPTLSYAISDATKVTAGLYYYKNEDMPDYGVRMSAASTAADYRRGAGTADDPFRPIDVPAGTFYATPGRDFTDTSNASGYVRLDHAFSDSLKLTATLRKNRDVTRYVVTQPGTTSATGIARSQKSTNRETETLSFNAQLSGDTVIGGQKHSFGIGVDISKADTTAYRWIVDGVPGASVPSPTGEIAYVDPDLGYFPVSFETGTRSSLGSTTSKSLYAFDVVELSPKWSASFGVNLTNYDSSTTSYNADGTTIATTTVNGATVPNDFSKSTTVSSGSVGLVFKPNDKGRIYASVATASNPIGLGSTPTESTTSAGNINLDPETSTSFELGTKWLLMDDQLMLSANLFLTDKENARVAGDDGTFENIGETRSKGIELGFAGQITPKWGISGGYVYQDVKMVDGGFQNIGTAAAPNYIPNIANGKQLAKVPKQSFSLWTTYAVTDQLTLGGGATYVGKRVASYSRDTATNEGYAGAVLPSSWRVDLMAAYQLAENTSLQLNVNNLFDKQIYGDSHVTQHVLTEPGRNFVLTLKHTF